MSKLDGLTVNFTFSPEACSEIERVRAILRAESPHKAVILSVGWGIFKPHKGGQWEAPALGFYDETDDPVILGGVERVDGMDVFFFILEEHYGHFAGKILDFSSERMFFLRDP